MNKLQARFLWNVVRNALLIAVLIGAGTIAWAHLHAGGSVSGTSFGSGWAWWLGGGILLSALFSRSALRQAARHCGVVLPKDLFVPAGTSDIGSTASDDYYRTPQVSVWGNYMAAGSGVDCAGNLSGSTYSHDHNDD